MSKFSRIVVIVLDSVGIGASPDAKKFGDEGADTLGHIGDYWDGQLFLPNLSYLGFSNIRQNPINGVPVNVNHTSYVGKMQEVSAGKDSMDGHWEMMGLPVTKKLDTFPNGFPLKVIEQIEHFSKHKVIVNKPYSGTEVIRDYGEQQLANQSLIVYTSGDSVLQVAANEAVVSVDELYRICRFIRRILDTQGYLVGRVIARPFVGASKDNFVRTANRKDFTLAPSSVTALDLLYKAGIETVGIGKINDIFSDRGLKKHVHTLSNEDGMNKVINELNRKFAGFCFANLVDFDAKYGHRRDAQGYGEALMRTDQQIGEVIKEMKDDDLLIITADHGNDPTFRGTDHTREYVPLIAYAKNLHGGNLDTRTTFADLGASVLENFGIENQLPGISFLNQLQ